MFRIRKRTIWMIFPLLVWVILAGRGWTGEGLYNFTSLEDRVFSGARGLGGINLASGEANLQLNLWSIALGAPAYSLAEQEGPCLTSSWPERALNLISGEAFSHLRGIFSVNQAAGSGNKEANLVAISLGQEVGNHLLARNTGTTARSRLPVRGEFADVISGEAFAGARGLVQVNQSSGLANTVSNQFSLGFKGPVP